MMIWFLLRAREMVKGALRFAWVRFACARPSWLRPSSLRRALWICAVAASGLGGSGCAWARHRQLRSAQLAARADLDLILRAEYDYRAKNGSYTTDLGSLPFQRKDLKSVLYKFGFTVASKKPEGARAPAGVDPSRSDLDKLKAARPDIEMALSPATKLETIEFSTLASFCADCGANETSFKAVAAANLDDDPTLDVWTINEKGEVVHLIDDLR